MKSLEGKIQESLIASKFEKNYTMICAFQIYKIAEIYIENIFDKESINNLFIVRLRQISCDLLTFLDFKNLKSIKNNCLFEIFKIFVQTARNWYNCGFLLYNNFVYFCQTRAKEILNFYLGFMNFFD